MCEECVVMIKTNMYYNYGHDGERVNVYLIVVYFCVKYKTVFINSFNKFGTKVINV